MNYFHIDMISDFDFNGDDSPSHYATSVVFSNGLVAFVFAALIPEVDFLTSGVYPENDLEFAEIIQACNADLLIGKDTSTIIVSNNNVLSKYAIMRIQWDKVVIDKSKTPYDITLRPDLYPFHFNFSPLERKAWNQLVNFCCL